MDSGTENLDATARVVRRIVTFTEAGGVVNIIVNGVNIGLTYRSQFASAVQDQKYGGDLDKVIDAWALLLANETPGAVSAEEDEAARAGGAGDGR